VWGIFALDSLPFNKSSNTKAAGGTEQKRKRKTDNKKGTSAKMFYKPGTPHNLPRDPFKACVIPRPIGWISSVSAGEQN
jgi:hypothetical protein